MARGTGFALAALLIELVVPFTTSRLEDAVPTDPVDLVPYLSGAALRLALEVAVFAAIAWTVAESRSRTTRVFAVLVSFALLFAEAGSYRWLGEHGGLLSFRGALFPMLAYTGTRALVAGGAALVGTAVALGIARLLEPNLAKRYADRRAIGVDLMLLGVAVLFGGAAGWLGTGSLALGATHPVAAWFGDVRLPAIETVDETPRPEFDPSGVRLPPDDILDVVRLGQQMRASLDLADPAHPYCRQAEPITRATNARSVVLLVLRQVSASAIRSDHPELPTLARLAGEGVSFERAVSGSDDATQGLVQILSGVSPLAPSRYHEMTRVPRLPSLPAALTQRGLATAYVSSFDLSPGRERTYLRDLAFGVIDEPSFGAEAARGATSGSDEATIDGLIARLDATRAAGPRFVAAPLGPTSLPSIEASLARFVAWFDANEKPRGTVLVVASDSAPAAGPDDSLSSLRFDVPLVFSNLRYDERNRGRARASSLVGLLDVADTILGIEGIGPTGCFQGRDLLAARETIPRQRRLLAFGGTDQSHVYVFDNRFRWQIDRSAIEGPFQVFDVVGDAELRHDLFDAGDSAVPIVHDQILAMLGLGRYLATNDRFVHGSRASTRTAITTTTAAQFAPLAGGSATAIVSSLAARKAAGFTGFVLAVAIDEATLEPTVAGKPLVDVLRSLSRPLGGLELALDIAMPEHAIPTRSVEAARKLALAVEAAALVGPVVFFPRDPIMATSLAARSTRRVLVRLPGNARELIELAEGFGIDGVVLSADAIESGFIVNAHARGLRVVVDGVGTRDALAAFDDAAPDIAIVSTSSPISLR